MNYSKSKYPVGATWKCVGAYGRFGTIWFSEVSDYGWEIWRWSVAYSDGTGGSFDWATSYSACKRHAPIRGKFKRVK